MFSLPFIQQPFCLVEYISFDGSFNGVNYNDCCDTFICAKRNEAISIYDTEYAGTNAQASLMNQIAQMQEQAIFHTTELVNLQVTESSKLLLYVQLPLKELELILIIVSIDSNTKYTCDLCFDLSMCKILLRYISFEPLLVEPD